MNKIMVRIIPVVGRNITNNYYSVYLRASLVQLSLLRCRNVSYMAIVLKPGYWLHVHNY